MYIDIIYTEYSRALESGAEIMCHVQNPMGRPKTWEHVMLTKLQVLLQLDVYTPENYHGTWKWWFPIGIPFSKGPFSGSMFVLGGVGLF